MRRALAVPEIITTAAPASAHRQNPIFVLITCLLSSPLDENSIARYQAALRIVAEW